jgi:hypothetical protein
MVREGPIALDYCRVQIRVTGDSQILGPGKWAGPGRVLPPYGVGFIDRIRYFLPRSRRHGRLVDDGKQHTGLRQHYCRQRYSRYRYPRRTLEAALPALLRSRPRSYESGCSNAQAQEALRVAVTDIPHRVPHQFHIVRKLAVFDIPPEEIAQHAAEVFVARVRHK